MIFFFNFLKPKFWNFKKFIFCRFKTFFQIAQCLALIPSYSVRADEDDIDEPLKDNIELASKGTDDQVLAR